MFNEVNTVNNSTTQDVKGQHIIDDVNFQKLLKIKNEVYQATEVNPTIRKLVNLIIEQADLEVIGKKLIKQYK